jgi:hypothetical protein
MVSADQARRIALALPDAVELDHHGKPSFRVRGKIFATLWATDELNVMLDEPGILTVVQAHPDLCREVWWGKKRAAVKVFLERATPAFVGEVLADAHEHKSGRS